MKQHTLLMAIWLGSVPAASTWMGCSTGPAERSESNDAEAKGTQHDEAESAEAKRSDGPDDNPVVEINSQLEQMTNIMKKHEEAPEEGVKALRGHLQDNLPNIMFALGTIIAEADKIDDPKERQKYLTVLTTQLALGFAQFGKYAEKYSEAIEGNDDASRFIKEWGESWAATAGTDLNGIQQLMSGF